MDEAERVLVEQLLAEELRKRFAGKSPTPREIKDAMVEICRQPEGDLKVEVDSNSPGTVTITGTGDYAELLKKIAKAK